MLGPCNKKNMQHSYYSSVALTGNKRIKRHINTPTHIINTMRFKSENETRESSTNETFCICICNALNFSHGVLVTIVNISSGNDSV